MATNYQYELWDIQSGNMIYYGSRKKALAVVAELDKTGDAEGLALGRWREGEEAVVVEGDELIAMARAEAA